MLNRKDPRVVKCVKESKESAYAIAQSSKTFGEGIHYFMIELLNSVPKNNDFVGLRGRDGNMHLYAAYGGVGKNGRTLKCDDGMEWTKKGEIVHILLDCERNEVGFWRNRDHIGTFPLPPKNEYVLELFVDPRKGAAYKRL